MGHKKRSPAPTPPSHQPIPTPALLPSIPLECERALTALRRGNYTKALRLMKDACSLHDNSALPHRVQATISLKVSSILDDSNAKQRHLRNAVESARRAVSLSPDSIEFAFFYSNLLYTIATEINDYEEVVKQCERALSIEKPIDPKHDKLEQESEVRDSKTTSKERIDSVQKQLQLLIQKSNISIWAKSNGRANGNEKLMLFDWVPEDPVEVRVVNGRRANGIRNEVKTLEERRKEIEVRVAAARLLQQKSESLQVTEENTFQCSSGIHTLKERQKSARFKRIVSSVERTDRVRAYWKTMSLDNKRGLMNVRIDDLKARFLSLKNGLALEVLLEAVGFANDNKIWKFWACCCCGRKFIDCDSNTRHVMLEHLGNLSPNLWSVLPAEVDRLWVEMIVNGVWKPVDTAVAVKMIENQMKFKSCSAVDRGYVNNDVESGNYDDGNGIVGTECDVNGWPYSDDAERAKILERIHDMFQLLDRHKCLSASHVSKVMEYTIETLQTIIPASELLIHGLNRTPFCICFLESSELKGVLNFLQGLAHSCGLNMHSEKGGSKLNDNALVGIRAFGVKERVTFSSDFSCLVLDERLLRGELTPNTYHDAIADDGLAVTSAIDDHDALPESDALISWLYTGPTIEEQLASWTSLREDKKHQGREVLQILEKEFYHLKNLCMRKCEQMSYEEAIQAVESICLEELERRGQVLQFSPQSYESLLRKRQEELVLEDDDAMLGNSGMELDVISNVLKEVEALTINEFGFEETLTNVTTRICDLECGGEDDEWRIQDHLHQEDNWIEMAIQTLREQLSIEISKIDARIMLSLAAMRQLKLKLGVVSAYDYRSIMLAVLKSFMQTHLEDLVDKDATEKSDAAREAFLAELEHDAKKNSSKIGDIAKHTPEKLKDKRKSKYYRKAKDSKEPGDSEQLLLHQEDFEQFHLPVAYDGDYPNSPIGVSVIPDVMKQQEEELRHELELEADAKKLEETLEYQRQIENEARQKQLAKQNKMGATTAENVSECMSVVYSKPSDDSGSTTNEPLRHRKPVTSPGGEGCLDSWNDRDVHDSRFQVMHIESDDPGKFCGKPDLLPNSEVRGMLFTCDEKSEQDPLVGKTGISRDASVVTVNMLEGTMDQFPSSLGTKSRRRRRRRRSYSCGKVKQDTPNGQTPIDVAFPSDQWTIMQDTFRAHENFPLNSMQRRPQTLSSKEEGFGFLLTDSNVKNMIESGLFGTGLKNDVGEYNCFLNVIIQSLWHLRWFRDEFMSRSSSLHVHVGDPCVFCALHDIFTALSKASRDREREAVAPTSLRIALSNLYPDSNFFQEGQMNDASEVLAIIFDCLHQAFTSSLGVVIKSEERKCLGSWDCASNVCLVHTVFGMDMFEKMSCNYCGLESRQLKYTSLFRNTNASSLRMMKHIHGNSSFDQLLKLVEMNHQLPCDPEVGGCGKLNHSHHFLSNPPHVFTTVLGWQTTSESADDISATLAALTTEINIGVLFRGVDAGEKYCLISVVCYYGQHYHCFAYSHEHERWIMYDDNTVKVVGCWTDVLTMCEKGHLQPQILFFEAIQ